ncbi:MAG TPA: sulfatase-like hydrolase/transferase, partial [Phycisphaerae bacterium]|nr:sulfatase-like hydrolase/transferase [Phycisphaerae bacterium]
GRWGHNSSFSEEQTLVPFVLWVPGRAPRKLDRMTSHLDLAATLMPLLGVKNPPEDYSFGNDLYSDTNRKFTILTDWNHVAYVDDDHKVIFSAKGFGFSPPIVTTRDDAEVSDPAAFFTEHKAQIVEMLKSLKGFGYRK